MTDPARANLSTYRVFARGASAVGAATILERGLGFLANVLAARLGGVQVFGAYSLALSTASSVATYAGAGIGATALRFSGTYPPGCPSHRQYLLALAIVSITSAVAAAGVLLPAAKPMARLLLDNAALEPLLQIAAATAAALILMDCFRNLLIGQQKFVALVAFSCLFGTGMLAFLPAAARLGASWMLVCQAGLGMLALLLVIVLVRPLHLERAQEGSERLGFLLRRLWAFGFLHVASGIGLNLAGWWVLTLVGRMDSTLTQVAYFSVGMQLRNIVSMVPGLMGIVSYPLMTDESGQAHGGAERVTGMATVFAALAGIFIGGAAMAVLPFALNAYGSAFRGAELPAVMAIGSAIVHMTVTPAIARLSVVSIRTVALAHLQWAITVAVFGSLFIGSGGAVAAMAAYVAGHVSSAAIVVLALRRLDAPHRSCLQAVGIAISAAAVLILLGCLRVTYPAAGLVLSEAIFLAGVVFSLLLLRCGQMHGWIPQTLNWARLTGADRRSELQQ
ncbi:MAG: oligosaccharide flippase family protein [Bryobacterales bacterium]|nr:oligosaccharide flippase family protein [Bryobacterales bacterium]